MRGRKRKSRRRVVVERVRSIVVKFGKLKGWMIVGGLGCGVRGRGLMRGGGSRCRLSEGSGVVVMGGTT